MTKKTKDIVEELGGNCITNNDDNVIFAEIDLTDVFNNQIKPRKEEPLEYTYENKYDYSDEEVDQLREQEKREEENK